MSNCKPGYGGYRSLALWRPELPNDVIIECKAIFSSVLEGILTLTAPDARQKCVRLGQTSPETLARILVDELETERRKSVRMNTK